MADGDKTTDGHWHLDRKVPLALILAIVLQTVTLIIWGTQLTERVSQLERTENVRATMAPAAADRLTRVEVKVDNIEKGVEEIKHLIRRGSP